MLEVYRRPLPNWRFRLWPTDTRSLVAAVFLGLSMTVALQIAERIDFAYSGGTMFLVASATVPQFENPAAMFFGLASAILVAWINPVVANLTASSPLSPLFFVDNALHTIPVALLTYAFKPKERGFTFPEFLVLTQVGGLLDALPDAWGAVVILGAPIGVAIVAYVLAQVMFVVGAFISFPVMHRLLRSGLVPTAELPDLGPSSLGGMS